VKAAARQADRKNGDPQVPRQFKRGLSMNASDVMITDVTTVRPSTKVQEAAEILVTKRISGMPVVDDSGKLVGMISEGDLIRRSAEGAWPKVWGPPPRRGWVRLLIDGDDLDTEYVTQPDRRVAEIMTYDIVSARPETSVSDIATLLVHHRIKRVPIVRNGKLVGLVSRANIIEALAGVRRKEKDVLPENHTRA
jgi:CBS domain-containing protein